MNYHGQKARECFQIIHNTIEDVAQKSDQSAHLEELRLEAFGILFGLVSKILAADGILSREESDFLDSALNRGSTGNQNVKFVQDHLAATDHTGQVPAFFSLAVSSDEKYGTDAAGLLIEQIDLMCHYACLSNEGAADEKEKSIAKDYVKSLKEYVAGKHPEPVGSTRLKYGDQLLTVTGNGKASAVEPQKSLEELQRELDGLIGLSQVKQDVTSLINLIRVRKMRLEKGMPVTPLSLHLVFSGNPGTGKTTVARLLARIYRAIGLLSQGQLVETDRAGLVAGYVGQTAIKVTDLAKKAFGGILFIDEAYALSASKSENDFGHEAIDTLLKLMEDQREDFIVIVAGYTEEMQLFLQSNPGLESRFNKFIHFQDYNPQELYDIFVKYCTDGGYTYDEACGRLAASILQAQHEVREQHFGNARAVRNVFEHTISNQANRVALLPAPTDDDLRTILAVDLPAGASFSKQPD